MQARKNLIDSKTWKLPVVKKQITKKIAVTDRIARADKTMGLKVIILAKTGINNLP